jgi:hypothetical protein
VEQGDVFAAAMLTIRDADLDADLRVPPVVDDGAFANMGRMNGDSP